MTSPGHKLEDKERVSGVEEKLEQEFKDTDSGKVAPLKEMLKDLAEDTEKYRCVEKSIQ